MATTTLEGIESIRVTRAAGNLKVIGAADAHHVTIEASVAPEITRNAGVAEVSVRSNATITLPAGVTIQIDDLAGNLEVSDLTAPLVVIRVRGNLDARRIGTIAIREPVGGNLSIKEAASIDGDQVRGSLTVDSARSVTFSEVAGHFECRSVAGEVAIEKISGSARLDSLGGPFIARIVGGHLEVATAGEVEAGVVGGKVRASNLSGALRIGKIGGKLALEAVASDVAIGFVGGHARIAKVGGALSLEEVGGAIDLSGPYPAGKTWGVRSRGRVSVEMDPAASIELNASARWGRIRVYGVEASGLKWLGHHQVHGPIGPEPTTGARMKLAIETRGGDVIVASADARERDFSGRGHRARVTAFADTFEDFADELGGEIPEFVRTVMDAAGKFVAESGGLSGEIVREVTRDVKRSVSEGVREVERAISEIEESAPREVGEKLARIGREIADLVSRSVRSGSREARDQMRERVRNAAREMRDTIREAARDVHSRSREEPGASSSTASTSTASAPAARPGATVKLNREDAILDILAAVKDGRLEPEEADDLINAWMEVRETDARR
jgi:hypothetical protein